MSCIESKMAWKATLRWHRFDENVISRMGVVYPTIVQSQQLGSSGWQNSFFDCRCNSHGSSISIRSKYQDMVWRNIDRHLCLAHILDTHPLGLIRSQNWITWRRLRIPHVPHSNYIRGSHAITLHSPTHQDAHRIRKNWNSGSVNIVEELST